MSTHIEQTGSADHELSMLDIADPSPEMLLAYRWMLLARRLDERMWQLIRQGKGHFAVPCQGHEAVGAGYALALRRGYDYIAPHYRDLAAVLAVWHHPPRRLASFFARDADPIRVAASPTLTGDRNNSTSSRCKAHSPTTSHTPSVSPMPPNCWARIV